MHRHQVDQDLQAEPVEQLRPSQQTHQVLQAVRRFITQIQINVIQYSLIFISTLSSSLSSASAAIYENTTICRIYVTITKQLYTLRLIKMLILSK